jgi:hypothetical protein
MHEPLTRLFATIAIVAALPMACTPSTSTAPQASARIVAVAPFAVAQPLRTDPERFGGTSPEAVSRALSAKVAETLRGRGARVLSASEVRRALEESGVAPGETGTGGRAVPPETARIVAEKLGANALLVGRLTGWTERQGSAASATRGATVTFRMALFDAPGGRELWSTSFDRTQRPLSENILQAGQLPGGGTRWLTAGELARWGVERTARRVPLD